MKTQSDVPHWEKCYKVQQSADLPMSHLIFVSIVHKARKYHMLPQGEAIHINKMDGTDICRYCPVKPGFSVK